MIEIFSLLLLECLQSNSIQSEVKVVSDVYLEHAVYSEGYSVCFNVYKSVE
jgi:hypothetical protein